MTLDERDERAEVCADCGVPVDVEVGRGFASGDGVFLCWECAVRRGGNFDPIQDRWVVAPDVADLPDERRPHT